MADNNTINFNQTPRSGKFSDVAASIDANFDLAKIAILNMKGKSAYEMWREEEGNENKTESEFWAFLTADKGYTKQAITLEEFNALTPTTTNTNIIYVHPNSNNTEYYAKVSNGTTWVTLLVNDGDITNISDRIGQIEEIIGTNTPEVIDFVISSEYGIVQESDGTIRSNNDFRNTTINLSDKNYVKLNFRPRFFSESTDSGYGFVLSNGNWVGYHGDTNEYITIPVPPDAISFKTSWHKADPQRITGYFNSDRLSDAESKIEGLEGDIQEIESNMQTLEGNIQEQIDDIESNFNTETEEVINFEVSSEYGIVQESDGQVRSHADFRNTTISLVGTNYTKLFFRPRYFSPNTDSGYGFLLSNGDWDGHHGDTNSFITIPIPSDAVLFKTSWYKTDPQQIKGYYKTDRLSMVEKKVQSLESDMENIDEKYDSIMLKPFTITVPDSHDIIDGITVDQIYQLWDALITQYPTYLSSTNIGYDESGTYTMRKINFGISGIATKKVIVIANIHGRGGDSHIPAYMMYWLANHILTNKATSELAQYILANFYFVIIPIGNPWGFDNETYGNSNNINLNRNFDAGFIPNDTGSGDALSGDTAASEAETQNIQAVINANIDAWMFVDFHSHPEPKGSATWNRDMEQLLPMKNATLEAQCTKIKEYGKIVGNDYITTEASSSYSGLSKNYADKCGIKRSLTIEAAASHPDERWNTFRTKAMTAAARLFLSLLRFE